MLHRKDTYHVVAISNIDLVPANILIDNDKDFRDRLRVDVPFPDPGQLYHLQDDPLLSGK